MSPSLPSFDPLMVCTVCGAIGADVRPNWIERAPTCLFGANSTARYKPNAFNIG
jgi:hypothetical protein